MSGHIMVTPWFSGLTDYIGSMNVLLKIEMITTIAISIVGERKERSSHSLVFLFRVIDYFV